MKNRHILLTTDFSEESMRAFEPVAELARALGAKITLLHAYTELLTVPHGYPYVPPVTVVNLAEQIARAEEELGQLRERLPEDLDVETAVESGGRIDEAICDYAKSHDVSLIAMSSHGRSGVRRLFLGSVAESVLRTSTIPVLVFPEKD